MPQLAEFWEESGERVGTGDLLESSRGVSVAAWSARRCAASVAVRAGPARGILTCAFDVQDTRVEGKIKAWGANNESWLIAHEVFWGNPSSDQSLWDAVDQFRLAERVHESGARIRPIITLIDSGDQTDAVYDYVQPRQNMNDCVFASKGVPFHTKPVLVQEGTTQPRQRPTLHDRHARRERTYRCPTPTRGARRRLYALPALGDRGIFRAAHQRKEGHQHE